MNHYNDIEGYDDNYYALFLCTQFPIYPEEAFYLLERAGHPMHRKFKLTELENRMMVHMHKHLSYYKMADILHLSFHAMYRRVKRYNEQKAQES
jgi:hypothetical protein